MEQIHNEDEKLEEIHAQAPDGSNEQFKEDITKAVITARIFPEEKKNT